MASSNKGWRVLACALGLLVASAPRPVAAWPGGTEKPESLATDARSRAMLEIVKRLDDSSGVWKLVLAPDGAHAALLGYTGEYTRLLMMDTATLTVRQIREYPGLDDATADRWWPKAVHWIDAGRLVVDWSDDRAVVMGLDGQAIRTVGTHVIRLMRQADGTVDDWAIVGDSTFLQGHDIQRVNLRTGEETRVPIGLRGVVDRVVFDKRGQLRAAVTRDSKGYAKGTRVLTWYRHDEQSPWQLLQDGPLVDYAAPWRVVGVLDDDRLLVVTTLDRDTRGLFVYDVKSRKRGDLVVGHPTQDLDADDTLDDLPDHVVTQGLKRTTWWFDADWDRIQRAVDAALPETTNVITGDPKGFVTLFSYSDREPGIWRMLDAPHMKMRQLARTRLAVDAAQMRPMQTFTYAAADGLKIPAYLTLPAGPEQPRPMVVLIHGGPVYRNRWGFDYEVQSLAAAGYAVFQPQFRGSEGFGVEFEKAGYGQWGLAMQDDITDGVKAMIARGVADPRRICIDGGSYGGYAAMWGLVKTPELYQCGVSWAGVSDIGESLTDWSDTNENDVSREVSRFRLGYDATKTAQFDAVSPEKHADRIRVPVLIGHGEKDVRVPIGHSRRLESALKAAHKPVQVQWYPKEGHNFSWDGDREHFMMLSIGFLDRHIGPASPLSDLWVPVPAAAAASAP